MTVFAKMFYTSELFWKDPTEHNLTFSWWLTWSVSPSAVSLGWTRRTFRNFSGGEATALLHKTARDQESFWKSTPISSFTALHLSCWLLAVSCLLKHRLVWPKMPMAALISPLHSQATGSHWDWSEGSAPIRQQATHISNCPSWQILFMKRKYWGGENCRLGFPWTHCWKLPSPTEVPWDSCNSPREGEKLPVVFLCLFWITR